MARNCVYSLRKNNRKCNEIYRITRRTKKLAEKVYNHFAAKESIDTLNYKDETK